MQLRNLNVTSLLLVSFVLLAGCNGNEKDTPKHVEQPTVAPEEEQSIPVVQFIQGEEKPDPPEQPTPTTDSDIIKPLHHHIISLPHGAEATHDQLRAYTTAWEQLKHLLNEKNISYTSDYRKTTHLTQAYITLGEYDKAIQNMKEQQERIGTLNAAGVDDPSQYEGLLTSVSIEDVEAMKQSTLNKVGEQE